MTVNQQLTTDLERGAIRIDPNLMSELAEDCVTNEEVITYLQAQLLNNALFLRKIEIHLNQSSKIVTNVTKRFWTLPYSKALPCHVLRVTYVAGVPKGTRILKVFFADGSTALIVERMDH